MRNIVIPCLFSCAILIGGALLAAITHGVTEQSQPLSGATISIDTSELTMKAKGLPPQRIDHLI
jgi:hypothetical protein